MENNIQLTPLEEELREKLVSLTISQENQRRFFGKSFHGNQYEFLANKFGINVNDLYEMLDHISRHDFAENKMPMLEAIIKDKVAPYMYCPTQRSGFFDLLHEFYGIETKGLSLEQKQGLAHRERKMAEMKLFLDHTFDLDNMGNPPIVAFTQTELERLTIKYYSAIIQGFFLKDYVCANIRYIVKGVDKPKLEYAKFGKYFFTEDGRLFVFSHNKDYAAYRNEEMENKIIEDSKWEYDGMEFCTSNYIEESGAVVVEAIFAGIMTWIKDKKTNYSLYTGDVVRVIHEYDGKPINSYAAISTPIEKSYFDYLLTFENDDTMEVDKIAFPLNYSLEKVGTSFGTNFRYLLVE